VINNNACKEQVLVPGTGKFNTMIHYCCRCILNVSWQLQSFSWTVAMENKHCRRETQWKAR